ncbi:thiol-disulfide oxidoreductase DCC family protein [Paenibacillus pinihumi]|uniref:thiol-disulfide oxidoreductase DCC family protein n=1 Tax=Paenibacillus pinihumi TaxID=669462 RepID=UPI000416881B|nr:thiol-disulfide oxidoreductase DCC family protein [Paenibacillus pinihumi]
MNNEAILLYDGVCSFCNSSVQFILKRDPHGYFRFAAQQSDTGQKLMKDHGTEHVDGIVLIEGNRSYVKTDAVVRICRHLPWPWRLGAALVVIPRFAREFAYGIFARNRYRWFGKLDSCMLPTPEQRSRFID